MNFRQQFLFTVVLMPLTFGIWFATSALLAGPATWLAGMILTTWQPEVIASTAVEGNFLFIVTHFGDLNGTLVSAQEAGYELATKINTRLVSYSIPFYAALLWASRIDDPIEKFSIGLCILWVFMALGLVAVAAKDMMQVVGDPFLNAGLTPPGDVIAVGYQFSVLLMPTLGPVLLWAFQLRGSPLWQHLERYLGGVSPSGDST